MVEPIEDQLPVSSLLAALAYGEHQVREKADERDVAEAAQAWELTPTEAFLEGKAAGLALAQEKIREKAGWRWRRLLIGSDGG